MGQRLTRQLFFAELGCILKLRPFFQHLGRSLSMAQQQVFDVGAGGLQLFVIDW